MDPVQQPSLLPLFVLGICFIFMYFLAIRPQNKERKQREAMISALEKGDEVMVASGILGTIKDIKGNLISLLSMIFEYRWPSRWLTPMNGIFRAIDIPFEKFNPTSKAPFNPAP